MIQLYVIKVHFRFNATNRVSTDGMTENYFTDTATRREHELLYLYQTKIGTKIVLLIKESTHYKDLPILNTDSPNTGSLSYIHNK